LFVVPKFLVNDDGSLGERNDVFCNGIEHKLGIHASPTCTMIYGDGFAEPDGAKGAIGWLVGEENRGLNCMFTMMNNARLGVGMQGIGIAEAAYQHALAFAMDRVQGKTALEGGRGTIIDHADVRRMLTSMKADIFAARCIGAACAQAIDMATATSARHWSARAALLTPIAKAFGSEVGIDVAEQGVQIHGGMGFVEETGAAQYSRDVRITTIYEGTNGIQAMDLVARKMMDGGEAAQALFEDIEANAEAAKGRFPELAKDVWHACETLSETTDWLVAQSDMNDRFAGAVPYLMGFARVLGAHYHLKAALGGDATRAKLAAFYIERLLPQHKSYLDHARAGAKGVFALSAEELAA
ncbi:MAG: acyl-CoA dehydrogenase, partial [Pseudomonadota bacterium]